ncbi:MAG: DivIVA domain-containing protein [Acidobacteria bacterium]|nr:DivIVA domain-containing protein [Acidobacteriota bacterium]
MTPLDLRQQRFQTVMRGYENALRGRHGRVTAGDGDRPREVEHQQ